MKTYEIVAVIEYRDSVIVRADSPEEAKVEGRRLLHTHNETLDVDVESVQEVKEP